MKILDLFIRRILPPTVWLIVPIYIFNKDVNTLGLGNLNYIEYPILIIGLLIYVTSLWHWDSKNTSTVINDSIYKYSRHPQWLCTVIILFGDIFIFNSFKKLIINIIAFIGFNLLIIFIEEPNLKKIFGDKYADYCKNTNRWITSRKSSPKSTS